MWEILERKMPSGCVMCDEPVVKGDAVFIYRFKAYRANKNIYIHAKHFKFKECFTCADRVACITENKGRCNIYNGVLGGVK